MKYRMRSRLKGILFPAIAAFFLGVGIIGCSSSGEEAAPDAALSENGETVNSDPLANNANAAVPEEGAAADGKTENNEELTNLVSEGSDNAASGENPALDPGLNANAGNDPFANPAAATNATENGALPIGGENNGADPFANADSAANTTADAANAANAPAANVTAESAPAEEIPAGNLPAWNAGNAENAGVANAEGNVSEENAPNVNEPALNDSSNVVSGPSSGFVPEKGAKMAYYVSRGDTLGTIAQKIYGNKGRWKELASNNNLTDPNKIYPGDALLYTLDDASQGFADKYESSSRQSVTVKAGDTLSGIAAKVFGSQGSWRTLWKENPSVSNPDRISAGMTLFYRSASTVAEIDDERSEVVSSLDGQE